MKVRFLAWLLSGVIALPTGHAIDSQKRRQERAVRQCLDLTTHSEYAASLLRSGEYDEAYGVLKEMRKLWYEEAKKTQSIIEMHQLAAYRKAAEHLMQKEWTEASTLIPEMSLEKQQEIRQEIRRNLTLPRKTQIYLLMRSLVRTNHGLIGLLGVGMLLFLLSDNEPPDYEEDSISNAEKEVFQEEQDKSGLSEESLRDELSRKYHILVQGEGEGVAFYMYRLLRQLEKTPRRSTETVRILLTDSVDSGVTELSPGRVITTVLHARGTAAYITYEVDPYLPDYRQIQKRFAQMGITLRSELISVKAYAGAHSFESVYDGLKKKQKILLRDTTIHFAEEGTQHFLNRENTTGWFRITLNSFIESLELHDSVRVVLKDLKDRGFDFDPPTGRFDHREYLDRLYAFQELVSKDSNMFKKAKRYRFQQQEGVFLLFSKERNLVQSIDLQQGWKQALEQVK